MKRFGIEEDDQFEMHVQDYTNQDDIDEKEMYNAAKTVVLKAQQGSGHHSGLTPKLRTLRTLCLSILITPN